MTMLFRVNILQMLSLQICYVRQRDTLDTLMDVLCRETDSTHLAKVLHDMGPDEKYTLVHQLLTPHFGPMFVTPKDIDETIQRISFIISEGINIALFGQVIKDR